MHWTILEMWAAQISRGEKPKAAFSIISLGGVQPEGYCIGWALTKRHANKQMEKYASKVGGKYAVVRMVST